MKNLYRLISFIFLSIIFCSGELTVSRAYDLDESSIDIINNNGGTLNLEGFISFQACDTVACIPINQDVIHEIKSSNNLILFGENLTSLDCNDNPKLPDWGALKINSFNQMSETSIKYSINSCLLRLYL